MSKRHFTRVNHSEWASVSYYDHVLFGDLENLSLQGLYFATDHKIPLNTLVKVDTPYSQITLNANVVRQDDHGLGMKIVDIRLSSLINLQKLISDKVIDKDKYLHEKHNIMLKLHQSKQVQNLF